MTICCQYIGNDQSKGNIKGVAYSDIQGQA